MEDSDLRKNDVLVGELKGMFEQFIIRYEENVKETTIRYEQTIRESEEWRRGIEIKIAAIEEFLNEIKTPHKYMVFALKAFALTAITGLAAIVGNYIKEHIRWL